MSLMYFPLNAGMFLFRGDGSEHFLDYGALEHARTLARNLRKLPHSIITLRIPF